MYLMNDRGDITWYVKELSRDLATPTERSLKRLKRLARYLSGTRALRLWCPRVPLGTELSLFVDADWAGDGRSRKSVSSAVLCLGPFILCQYTRSQAVLATSSCESEVYAMASGLSESIGVRQGLEFLGSGTLSLKVHTDATTAMAVSARQGRGKLRHLSVRVLWIQQAVRERLCIVTKVGAERNLADIGTKALEQATFERLRRGCGLVIDLPSPKERVPQGVWSLENLVASVTTAIVQATRSSTVSEIVRLLDRLAVSVGKAD
jgi:hypothetical protein